MPYFIKFFQLFTGILSSRPILPLLEILRACATCLPRRGLVTVGVRGIFMRATPDFDFALPESALMIREAARLLLYLFERDWGVQLLRGG